MSYLQGQCPGKWKLIDTELDQEIFVGWIDWHWAMVGFIFLLSSTAGLARVAVIPERVEPGSEITVIYDFPWAADELCIHYGFNGWNLELTGLGVRFDQSTGNFSYFIDRPMVWRWDWHRYQTTIRVPVAARSLHMAFQHGGCETGHWDNNQGQDYNWPISFPFAGPVLQVWEQDDPETSIHISFINPYPAEGWLEYWSDHNNEHRILRTDSDQLHVFSLQNLTPGTEYSYRVGLGTIYESNVYRFRTLDFRTGRFAFVLFGDAQDNGENRRFFDTIAAISDIRSDFDLVVGVGDYPWSNTAGDWWTFFDRGKNLFATKPFISVPGNHERRPFGSFLQLAVTPSIDVDTGKNVDVGNTRFLLLDTNLVQHADRWRRQLEWLDDQLEGTEKQWIFVLGHHPILNLGATHFNEQRQYFSVAQLISGRADWYFSGHEHFYQRTEPLHIVDGEFQIGLANSGVTRYLVVPPSGAQPHRTLSRSPTAENMRKYFAVPNQNSAANAIDSRIGFVKVVVQKDQLSVDSYGQMADSNGFNLMDQIQYRKPSL